MSLSKLRTRAASLASRLFGLPVLALVASQVFAGPAAAAVILRVEARPASDPIEAFVRVTDANGNPVPNLTSAAFTVTIDGDPITIQPGDVTLPSAQDPDQQVSVVFVMDYSVSVTNTARDTMEQAVVDFVETMTDGDQAAIIKFNTDAGATVIAPFTTIDHGAGNDALEVAARSDYPGNGTNLLDALELAVNQFVTAVSLPDGPRAVIAISDGGENDSAIEEADLIALANASSTPIFTIGVGDLTIPGREDLLIGLGGDTGGQYFPTASDDEIAEAYADISLLLTNEYLITIPSGISDCAVHTMQVTVAGQTAPATIEFTRRSCDTEPNQFSFTAETNAIPSQTYTSDEVTIGGIEAPAHISVIGGRYSIGCIEADFTNDPGTIEDGETVCVRQQASGQFSSGVTSTLTIGGVAGTYTVTTRSGSGGGGGGGGGGTTGGIELLLGLAALLARRRLHA